MKEVCQMFGNFTEYSVKLPNIQWNYRIFGEITEYSAMNKQLPNIRFRPNIRWFLDGEGSFSAETQKSGIGDSLCDIYPLSVSLRTWLQLNNM